MLSLLVDSECCLKGADPSLVSALKDKLTIVNPKFEAAQKYGRWVGNKIPRKLYFYKEYKSGFFMPRGFARQALAICAELSGQQLEIIDKRRTLPVIDFTFHGKLRPYQQDAVDAILSKDFGVLEAGTGSGKTIMALFVISKRKQPTIIIVHTKELLYQWAERVESFLKVKPGLVGDGSFSISPITIAIVNSARKKLDELTCKFGFILVDECHRVPATLFTDVVNAFDGKFSLGLSATAFRRENALTKTIYFHMGERVHTIEAKSLQEDGAILKPEILSRPTGFTFKYRDNYAAMLTALTVDDPRNRQIADDILSETKNDYGTILLVSDRVAHCEKLQELLIDRGCNPALLTGKVTTENRMKIVASIKKGEIDVLISTLQLIGEGFDAPGLSTLFLATPIKYSGRLQQVIGRILRPAKNKKARVFDYVDEKVGVLKASARQRQKTYFQISDL